MDSHELFYFIKCICISIELFRNQVTIKMPHNHHMSAPLCSRLSTQFPVVDPLIVVHLVFYGRRLMPWFWIGSICCRYSNVINYYYYSSMSFRKFITNIIEQCECECGANLHSCKAVFMVYWSDRKITDIKLWKVARLCTPRNIHFSLIPI